MIIKCKMCGGDIQFNPGDTNGLCDHCGCTTTFPKLPDEQRANLFNRANHFRRQCEFDKAMAAYEHILEEDDTDAEAHWGIVLCKFGIEYVEDPVTHERIPTCHRAQVISILSDEDYQNALKYAPDIYSREIYEKEAKKIAEIQKGILAISSQEKPYDVFICYKETDDSGSRTKDSTLAQDIYYQLTNEGYKVFFSRITLEDKLGQEYEPYIFAALNSAKVMLVVGTKPEFFNAVWVKNEWNRYLALMKNDRKRVLIPCYRDMDPYDLPEELSALQSQDMGKIGFMQDLIRGIRKVLDVDKKTDQPRFVQQVVQTTALDASAPGVTSLMRRAYLFLEDGDFSSAAEYLDRVLDIDPQFAPAYAAKVCVTFGLRKEAALAETTFQYEDNPDWQKALRFADAQQKAVYEGYAAKVKERVTRQIRDYAWDCAVEMAVLPGADRGKLDAELAAYRASCTRSTGKRADGSRRADSRMKEDTFNRAVKATEPGDVSESALKTAAAMFDAIGDAEAKEGAKQCRQLAEQARQKAVYLAAAGMRDSGKNRPSGLEEAARKFLSVPDYKDAKMKAQACVDQAEALRSGLYDFAVRAMNVAGEESAKWETVKKKLAEAELNGYRDVEQLRAKAAKRYEECVAAEQEVRRQAAKRYEECVAAEQEARRQAKERLRREAEAAAAKKKRNTIIGILSAVIVLAAVLVVTMVIIPGNNYRNAVALQQAGKYEEAITAFEALNGYSDSAAQITETKYLKAKYLTTKGDYAEAAAIFIGIKGYKDVDSLLENDDDLSAAARDAKYSVGNYVTFGHYPQTSGGNDSTAIEWLVVARDGQKALLLSRYGLDAQPYNTQYTDITWEKCTLRTWLNGTFLNKAFTAQEQGGILLTNVDNSKSQCYSGWSTSGGNNTQDKVFLLSYAEANKYLGVTYENSNNTKSRVAPTAYALKQGTWTTSSNKTADGMAAGWWWLRSPGSTRKNAADVNTDGSLNFRDVNFAHGYVRPALWINLESDIF